MHSRSLEPLLSSRVGLHLADELSDGTVAAGPANSVLEGAVFSKHTHKRQLYLGGSSGLGLPYSLRAWRSFSSAVVADASASVLFRQDATKIPAFADRLILPHAARTSSFLITIVRLHIASMHRCTA